MNFHCTKKARIQTETLSLSHTHTAFFYSFPCPNHLHREALSLSPDIKPKILHDGNGHRTLGKFPPFTSSGSALVLLSLGAAERSKRTRPPNQHQTSAAPLHLRRKPILFCSRFLYFLSLVSDPSPTNTSRRESRAGETIPVPVTPHGAPRSFLMVSYATRLSPVSD